MLKYLSLAALASLSVMGVCSASYDTNSNSVIVGTPTAYTSCVRAGTHKHWFPDQDTGLNVDIQLPSVVVTVTGKSDEAVNGGQLQLDVSLNNVHLLSEQSPLGNGIPLPILPGPFTFYKTITAPPNIQHGAYNVTMNFFDNVSPQPNQLACLNFIVNI